MGEIRAEWRRSWQVKPYESETITLAVTEKTDPEWDRGTVLEQEAELFRQLAELGDRLMEERVAPRL